MHVESATDAPRLGSRLPAVPDGAIHRVTNPSLQDGANRYLPGMARGRVVIRAAVLAVLIAGCTSEATPAPTPSDISASPTANLSPSLTPPTQTDPPTPPQRPEAMAMPSADGAAAAASHFVSLFPYIFATGDVAEWNAMSADDCGFCANTRTSVEEQMARGVRGEGSEITIHSARGTEISPGDAYSADIEFSQAPSFEVSMDGTRTPDGEGGRFRIHVALWWRDGWIVRAIDSTRV